MQTPFGPLIDIAQAQAMRVGYHSSSAAIKHLHKLYVGLYVELAMGCTYGCA